MLQAGDWIAVVTGGSGGYGSPALRDPRKLAQDLKEGRMPLGSSARDSV
jgi:N-methylhydantoinase B/oxoprolinase/acetone carboxylase alpha subunit